MPRPAKFLVTAADVETLPEAKPLLEQMLRDGRWEKIVVFYTDEKLIPSIPDSMDHFHNELRGKDDKYRTVALCGLSSEDCLTKEAKAHFDRVEKQKQQGR